MADHLQPLIDALSDRYRVERELGRGGMGVVLLAEDLKHGRRVAIKVLRPEIAQGVSAERFQREIRIAAQLSHPNILQLLDSGRAADAMYYVMPYVPGESLRARMDREQQLPIDDAIGIAREVADALSFAHDHGVVHRDIKPENILLGAGHALVSDFGIARVLDAGADRITETGIAVGTVEYMSPEQAAGAGTVDHRTDIYSLGCVLYEMLTGTLPFSAKNPMAVMARKAVEPAPGLRVLRDTIPVPLEQLVMKALSRVPADRFATAHDMARALGGDTSTFAAPHALGASRRRWMAVGAAAALLFIAGMYVTIAGVPFRGGNAPLSPEVVQLTTQAGVEQFPSVSADGKWIVYSSEESGNRDIYLQSVGGQAPVDITRDSPVSDDQPAISPDGEQIAFRSERGGGGIFVMGRMGEGARRLTSMGFRPTWSPDGQQIAFTTENVELNPGNSVGISELWVVDVKGGPPRRITGNDAILASWSPHNKRIAFGRRLGVPAQGDIWTVGVDGRDPKPVIVDVARDWSPAWSPDGRWLYFASDRGGSMNLWRIPIDESSGDARGAPQPVTTPATFLAHPAVAGDGRHIAYSSAQISINIQRMEFDPVAGEFRGEPTPVTSGSRRWSSPDPSPDGSEVAFYTLTRPEGHIYIAKPDGSGLRQITSDTAIDRVPRWSPDGKVLAFFSTRSGGLRIWTIRADGSDLRRVLAAPGGAYGPAWSPDGKRMALVLGPNAIGDSIAIADVSAPETQTPEMLPPSTVGQFLVNSWSPDGKRLAAQIIAPGGLGQGIAVYSFEKRKYEKIVDHGEWPVWLPDSRRLLFVSGGKGFYIVDIVTKKVRRVYTVTRDVIGPPRLTRDGRTAYFGRRVTEADVWMLTLRN